MSRTRKLYGGFVNGKLDTITVDTGWGGFGRGELTHVPMLALFKNRQHARSRYQDVRPVYVCDPSHKENTDG